MAGFGMGGVLSFLYVDSVRFKIEVSAVTGLIEEMQIEAWQIGPNSVRP